MPQAVLAEPEVQTSAQRCDLAPCAVVATFVCGAATTVGIAPSRGGVLVAIAAARRASTARVAAEGFEALGHRSKTELAKLQFIGIGEAGADRMRLSNWAGSSSYPLEFQMEGSRMSPVAMKGIGIGCFVVCAILLFVAWDRYQDNANQVDAINKIAGPWAGWHPCTASKWNQECPKRRNTLCSLPLSRPSAGSFVLP